MSLNQASSGKGDSQASSGNGVIPGVDDGLLITSNPQPGVLLLLLNRPSKRNALSAALIQELLNALAAADADTKTRVVVIAGSGNNFSAGADLKEIAQLGLDEAYRTRYLEDLCRGLDAFSKPIIAAVEGMALGGGFELALMCDLLVMSEESRLGFPEVNIGLIPGAGGTQRLTSIVGKFQAMRMILTGESISAKEAVGMGLTSKGLSVPGKSREDSIELGIVLASKSSSACMFAKEAVKRAESTTLDLAFERSLYYAAFGTKDKEEGVNAFLQKRSPVWAHTRE